MKLKPFVEGTDVLAPNTLVVLFAWGLVSIIASFDGVEVAPLTPPFRLAKGFDTGCALLVDAPKVKEDEPGAEKLNDCC